MLKSPCFDCPLPDCDDKSPRCAFRIALNAYQQALRKGLPISAEMRERYAQAKSELYPKARPQEWRHGHAKD